MHTKCTHVPAALSLPVHSILREGKILRKEIWKNVLPVAGAASLLVAELVGLRIYDNSRLPERYAELVQAEDYSGANDLYEKRIINNKKASAAITAEEEPKIEAIDSAFTSGQISYDTAVGELSMYKELDSAKVKAGEIEEHITTLETSHEAYAAGAAAEAAGDLQKAQDRYTAVIGEDVNYPAAQERIAAITEIQKNNAIAAADALAANGQYEEAVAAVQEVAKTYGVSDDLKAKLYEYKKASVAAVVDVFVIGKHNEQANIFSGEFGSRIYFTFRIKNRTAKDISSISGSLTISDAEMNTLTTQDGTFDMHVIAADETYDETSYYLKTGDFTMSELDKTLMNTPFEAMRCRFDVKKVTFADGTSVSVE